MKKVFVLMVLLVLILVQASFAELLTTANPIGAGKWAFQGNYLSDSNVLGSTALSAGSIGAFVGYGLNNKLDLYLAGGSSTINGAATTIVAYGPVAIYNILDEMNGTPVSVSIAGGYRFLASTTTGLSTANGNQMFAGVGISKLMIPFIPYGGLVYRSTSSNSAASSTQIDLTVGSAIAWSQQGAVFVEYTSQQVTLNGGATYSSGQIGAGVGYKI